MKDFVDPSFQSILKKHGILDFETLWDLPLEPLDVANDSRGGSSNAYRLQLTDPNDQHLSYIIKKQQDHLTRSFLKPWQKIPTFEREWNNSLYLEDPVIQFCYFAKRGTRAMLVSRELTDFTSLEDLLKNGTALTRHNKARLLRSIANNIASIHHARFVHKSLYAKHMFVAPDKNFKSITIDLEKSRPFWPRLRIIRDLTSLLASVMKLTHLSQTDQMRFLLFYFGAKQLTPEIKKYWHLIEERRKKRARSA